MQEFINRQFFNLTVFTLIFGVMFYDVIHNLGFSYVDEICAVLLLLLFGYKVLHSKGWEFNRMFLFVSGVFVFYLIYSFAIHANTKSAILTDFVIQLKPYLAFFCVYAIHPRLTENQRRIIRQLILLCSLYVLLIGVVYFIYYDLIVYTFGHMSRLATASSILALLYLYCSDYSKTDKMIFILLLSIGILSGRSKHFGFFAISLLIMIYFNKSFKMKLNARNTAFIIIALACTLFVAREKIYFYFITGGFGDGRTPSDLFARMALYYYSLEIFTDYFPFGTGFGTYATHASALDYSPIYIKYGMQNMHGLTKEAPAFISDTYFPALAQFGIAGVILFFTFWIYLARKAMKVYRLNCHKEATIALIIIIFFMIESTTDSTITHNRGMFIMMLLGLLFSDIHAKLSNSVHGTDENFIS
ncbi:MAG: O-antigen ligase family protein [Tannerella sp.]|jgi:uncharacterized membrane protein YuzA (DUF378 family)|nr:O-antigen ligase family protein [Tannerella sp.]